jgi:hypothetical protein
MAETTQWEYRVISAGTFWTAPKDEDLEGLLNELGAEGWEVFSIYTQHGTNKVFIAARRPLSSAARRRQSWPG